MANNFSGFKFRYKFRDYQARVLSEIPHYLDDGKVHIVAAPGAGKTALALQIMIDFGEPALVLAPTIALREQWLARFKDDFTNGEDLADIVSDDINDPKILTVVTYQALYSKYADVTKKDKAAVASERLREAGIKVIILDEAHHLKSAWLDAVGDIIRRIGDITTISLTATPPYDMKSAVWKKYIALCGDIDIEITVPELVKKDDLARHQDYIYFNYPNKSQLGDIEDTESKIDGFVEKIRSSEDLVKAILLHDGLVDINTKLDYFIDNFDYYLAMLKFLHANHIGIPANRLAIADSSIANLNLRDLEILLTYSLGPDAKSYADFSAFFREVRKELNSFGAIAEGKVTLHETEDIRARVTQNIGKLNSIRDIVEEESRTLDSKLKLVIITDNIYKSALDLWDETEFKSIGVTPIFAMLVRGQTCEAIVLTGEIIIIPARLQDELFRIAYEYGIGGENITVQELSFDFDYAKVSFAGEASKKSVELISCLFERSDARVLVGSNALIGEGWDAPFVNALIMATSIASFVTSNQIRGRAIRTNKADTQKSANIWHLVCVEKFGQDTYSLGQDFQILKRRFEAFEGIGADGELIDYGIERLNIGEKTYTGQELAELNKSTLNAARDRERMKNYWTNALLNYEPVKINKFRVTTDEETRDIEILRTRDLGFMKAFSGLNKLLRSSLRTVLREKSASVFSLKNGALYFVGDAILKTLTYMNIVNADARLIFLNRYGQTGFYLQNSTFKENSVFRGAFIEMLSEIEDPRYIIEAKGAYFAVPDIIGTNKVYAEFLLAELRLSSKGRLIFTKTPDGKVKLFMIKLQQRNIQASWADRQTTVSPGLTQTDINVQVMKDELKMHNLS